MGYHKEREIKRAKRKKRRRILFSIFTLLCAGGLIFSSIYPPNTWKYYVALPKISSRADGELRLHFLDVGQGDCTIVEFPDGKILMIDGGDGSVKTSKTVLRYLNALKIDTIDFLVATNPSSYRVGALDEVVRYKDVLRVYRPYGVDYTCNSEYAEFLGILEKEDCVVYDNAYNEGEVVYGEREYGWIMLSPQPYEDPTSFYHAVVDEKNYSAEAIKNISATILVSYQGVNALLMSDAGTETERFLYNMERKSVFETCKMPTLALAGKTSILKLSDHGSARTSDWFLEYLGVKDGIVSCGDGADDSASLEKLLDRGITRHATDEVGSVIVTIDENGRYWIE